LTCMFRGAVWTWPLKNFSNRGRGQGHMTPIFFALSASNSEMVKLRLQI